MTSTDSSQKKSWEDGQHLFPGFFFVDSPIFHSEKYFHLPQPEIAKKTPISLDKMSPSEDGDRKHRHNDEINL